MILFLLVKLNKEKEIVNEKKNIKKDFKKY